ncbi:MAG: tetratricopeptide repeat protein, partial [Leptodesmis sp.]|uniref:tetratricopeptide repeat protein n=1 Tax=Leptodesmis sp. TaxID=3100501 RepID=UPI003D10B717
MAAGTEYAQEYQRAQIAYMNGSYDEAATIVDRLVKDFPSDPSACLLRGHIY